MAKELECVHKAIKDLYESGFVDDVVMRRLDVLCKVKEEDKLKPQKPIGGGNDHSYV